MLRFASFIPYVVPCALLQVGHTSANHLVTDGTASTATFGAYIKAYGRSYQPGTSEYEMRYELFKARLAKVEQHNSQPDRLWTAVLNHLSDRTPHEMKAFGGWRRRMSELQASSIIQEEDEEEKHKDEEEEEEAKAFIKPRARRLLRPKPARARNTGAQRNGSIQLMHSSGKEPLPDEVSWTKLWTTQPEHIRNQHCSNCWAAATSAMLEAHAEIHTGVQRTFSQMEITQCTPDPFKCGGDGGCSGSTPELALQHVLMNGIGDQEENNNCPANAHSVVDPNEPKPHEWGSGVRQATKESKSVSFGMVGWERLPENKYEPLMRAVVERGPVAVAVSTDWHDFGHGIYDGCNKNAVIDHSVLLIGYGKDKKIKNTKYWLLQNSWGSDWGENGHFRLKREDAEEKFCGTDSQPQMGTTCKDGPTQVKVCGKCGMLYDTVVPHFKASTPLARQMAASRGEPIASGA